VHTISVINWLVSSTASYPAPSLCLCISRDRHVGKPAGT